MERLTNNTLAFFFGLMLVAGVADCANAHEGHILDHDDVSKYLFCSSAYAYNSLLALQDGDYEQSNDSTNRSNMALNVAGSLADHHGHGYGEFATAANIMFLKVGDSSPRDVLAFFTYFDCDAATSGEQL